MKTLNFWRTLFLSMLAVTAVACTDNDEEEFTGIPEITVNGAADASVAHDLSEGYTDVVKVVSSGPWTLAFENEGDKTWCTPSVNSGNGGETELKFYLAAASEARQTKVTLTTNGEMMGYPIPRKATITIMQGDAPEAGPVGKLVEFIKTTHASVANGSSADLGYSETTIEAVILANNEYGNNFGKLYVGDNTKQPNSAIVLYSTSEFTKSNSTKYPVGKKVTLDLSAAKYAPFGNLRELKDVAVTVSEEDAVELVIPTLSAAQLNTGDYQGQYVKVVDVTPQSSFVGTAWATSAKRTVKMDAGSETVQSYMSKATDATDFASLIIGSKTGAILGTAEQNFDNIQIIPVKPSDVAELSSNDPVLTVSPETVTLNSGEGASASFSITSNGSWTISKASGNGFEFSPESGSGNGTVTVTASAANTGSDVLTLGTLTISDGTNDVTVTVKQDIPSNDILFENWGNTPVSDKTDLSDFTGFLKQGTGVTAETTYSGTGTLSIRTAGAPKTDALSGGNSLWIGAGAVFYVNNLKLAADQNDLKISFGAEPSKGKSTTDDFTIALSADGKNWVDVKYTLSEITGESYYQLAAASVKLTNSPAVENLSIRISATVGTRIEDLTVATAVGGEDIELPAGGDTPTPTEATIGEIKTAGDYKTTGTVVARSKLAYIIADETGAMMVYHNNNERTVGDKITIEGDVTIYDATSTPQFSNAATVTVVSTGNSWTYNPEVLDAAGMDALLKAEPVCKEVQFEGALSLTGDNNKYANVTIAGAATAIGSIKYIDNATIESLNGKNVVVKGYFIGTSSSKYVNVLPYSVEEVAGETPDPAEPAITAVDPEKLTWAAAETDAKTINVAGVKLTDLAAALSGANADKWGEPTVAVAEDGTTATITVAPAAANESDADYTATLTLTLGSITKTVALTQSKPASQGGGEALVVNVDFTALPSDFPTTAEKTQKTFNLSGYDFTFIPDTANGYKQATSSGKTYLLFGKTGAAVEFPAIEGKKLVKVVCVSRNGASGNVKVGIADGSGNYISGGEAIQWKQEEPYTFTYVLTDTAVNTAYRLLVANKYNAQLTSLELTFE